MSDCKEEKFPNLSFRCSKMKPGPAVCESPFDVAQGVDDPWGDSLLLAGHVDDKLHARGFAQNILSHRLAKLPSGQFSVVGVFGGPDESESS